MQAELGAKMNWSVEILHHSKKSQFVMENATLGF